MAPTYLPPTAIVEYAPGFSPRSLPSSGDWVALTIGGKTRALSFTMSRGRDDLTEDFNSGTATFVLDNSDQMLDEANPSSDTWGTLGQALTPIRFRMIDNDTAVTSTIWTGYVTDGWRPSGSMNAATVTVKAVDWMGWAATQETPEARWVQFVQENQPTVWWRGRMSSGVATSTNGAVIYDEGSAGLDGSIFTAGTNAQWVPPLVTGEDEEPAWRLQTAARFSTGATASVPTGSGGWWFACWFQIIDVGTQGRYLCLARTGSNTGNARWGVRIGNSGHVAARVYDAAGTVLAEAVVAVPHNDGEPHVVFVNFQPSSIYLRTDLGFDLEGVAGTPAGGGGWLTTGAGVGSDSPVLMDEFAYWADGAGPYSPLPDVRDAAQDLSQWVDESTMSGYAWNDTQELRLQRIMRMMNLDPADVFDYFDVTNTAGFGLVGDWVPRSTLAGHVETTGKAMAGVAWARRDGRVRVRTYPELGSAGSASAEFTNAPTPAGILPVIRYHQNPRSGRLLSRVINEIRINGGSPRRDRASIETYGRRVYDLSGAAEPSVADPAAAAIIAARKEPTSELDEITFTPWGNQAATTWALAELELEEVVTYTEYDPTGTTAYVANAALYVQSESWSWVNGSYWTIGLKLA